VVGSGKLGLILNHKVASCLLCGDAARARRFEGLCLVLSTGYVPAACVCYIVISRLVAVNIQAMYQSTSHTGTAGLINPSWL